MPKRKLREERQKPFHPAFPHPYNSLVDRKIRYGGFLDPSFLTLYEGITGMEVKGALLLFLNKFS